MAQLKVEFIDNGRVVATQNTDVPDGATYVDADWDSGSLLVRVQAAGQDKEVPVAEPRNYDRLRVSIDGLIVAEPAALV